MVNEENSASSPSLILYRRDMNAQNSAEDDNGDGLSRGRLFISGMCICTADTTGKLLVSEAFESSVQFLISTMRERKNRSPYLSAKLTHSHFRLLFHANVCFRADHRERLLSMIFLTHIRHLLNVFITMIIRVTNNITGFDDPSAHHRLLSVENTDGSGRVWIAVMAILAVIAAIVLGAFVLPRVVKRFGFGRQRG